MSVSIKFSTPPQVGRHFTVEVAGRRAKVEVTLFVDDAPRGFTLNGDASANAHVADLVTSDIWKIDGWWKDGDEGKAVKVVLRDQSMDEATSVIAKG